VARDLGDVLHWFAPELGGAGLPPGAAEAAADPLPSLIGIPLPCGDVVRGALVWNLAVEVARRGVRTGLVSARALGLVPGWAAAGSGPLGIESLQPAGDDPPELARAAQDVLRRQAARGPALVLAALPPAWLSKGADAAPLLRWTLSLVRPDQGDARDTWTALEAIATQAPGARLGVAIFGVRSIDEARRCFERLAEATERRLDQPLVSYGVLADDVHLSRALLTGRPVVLARPQAASARALAEVADLLLGDAAGDAYG
jgi:hypothetical protein